MCADKVISYSLPKNVFITTAYEFENRFEMCIYWFSIEILLKKLTIYVCYY